MLEKKPHCATPQPHLVKLGTDYHSVFFIQSDDERGESPPSKVGFTCRAKLENEDGTSQRNTMQIICLNIHSLIIAEGGAKGPCRPAIEPSRTWQGLTLRKDASVDFAFASAVRNPFLAGVGSGFNLLFLIARNKLSYCCCLQNHIQKTRDRDTPPPAMPTELFHRIPTRCIRSSSAPNTQR